MNSNFSTDYLNNQLSESDELLFEQQLQRNRIKNKYEQFLVEEGLYVPKETFLQVVHKKARPMLKAAAVFGVISMVGWQIWSRSAPTKIPNLEASVQQYLGETAQIPQKRMSATNHNEQNWAFFTQEYANKNYEKAITFIQLIEPKEQDEYYYFGLCYLYQADTDYVMAIRYLNQSLQLGKMEAAWYLALAQLKLEDKTAARQSLQHFLSFSLTWKRMEAEKLLKTF